MSKLSVTDFSYRTGSPFQTKNVAQDAIVHEEIIEKTFYDKQKQKQNELLEKVSKKTAEIQSNKPPSSDGCFTEVVTHGAFTTKNNTVTTTKPAVKNSNGTNSKSTLLGFPSSANDLALDAKTDLESDPNISKDVKEKVIDKLFTLVSMVQHAYEAKVRIMSEFEKYKDIQQKNEYRREKEHSEQLYKVNLNFQSEVIQAIQQLKSELDISRNASRIDGTEDKGGSIDFNSDLKESDDDKSSNCDRGSD